MSEQTIPEPPDRHALYWPARDDTEVPVLIIRDDELARRLDPGLTDSVLDRWFVPNAPDTPGPFAELVQWAEDEGYPLGEAVVLAPTPEVVNGHVREAGGYCRTDGVVHSPEEWQRIADRAAEGGQSGG